MYKAKENGKNQFVLCSPILKDKINRMMEVIRITSYNVCYTKLLRESCTGNAATDTMNGDKMRSG